MAGWRIGPARAIKLVSALGALIKLSRLWHLYPCFQVAAIAAWEGDRVRDIAEQYKRRRDVLVKGRMRRWMVEMPKAFTYAPLSGAICGDGIA